MIAAVQISIASTLMAELILGGMLRNILPKRKWLGFRSVVMGRVFMNFSCVSLCPIIKKFSFSVIVARNMDLKAQIST